MGLLKFLPQVNRFCWCTRNLKCASFTIIIVGMITGVNTAGFLCMPPCKELYEVSSPMKLVANVFRWLLFSSELLLLASIFGFLLGIFYSIRVTADVLICTAIVKCIISALYGILILVQEQFTHCRWYTSQIFHLVIYIMMWCYFIIVVNSYQDKM
nr:uncharacterized protein LOC116769178 [Danaus plexippus plexippus]